VIRIRLTVGVAEEGRKRIVSQRGWVVPLFSANRLGRRVTAQPRTVGTHAAEALI
jgi:hypothetical protein